MKDLDLAYLGDNYVVAQWYASTGPEIQIVAIFRDLTDDGVTSFVISQVFGPWSRYNPKTKELEFDVEYNDVFIESYQRSLKMLDTLNKEKEIPWEGNIHRY